MKISRIATLLICLGLVSQLTAAGFGSEEGFVEDSKPNVGMDNQGRDEMYFETGETIPPREIDWLERGKFGSNGNVTAYLDKNGTPVAVYVLGAADIPTGGTELKCMQYAQRSVERHAKAAFALWMKEYLTVKNTFEGKTLVVNADNMATLQAEEKEIEKYIQIANATWRGMEPYWHKKENGVYFCVWRWTLNGHRLAAMVELLTRDGNVSNSALTDDTEGFLRDGKRKK